jgi:hypothetical protein
MVYGPYTWKRELGGERRWWERDGCVYVLFSALPVLFVFAVSWIVADAVLDGTSLTTTKSYISSVMTTSQVFAADCCRTRWPTGRCVNGYRALAGRFEAESRSAQGLVSVFCPREEGHFVYYLPSLVNIVWILHSTTYRHN